jgi:predicted lipoprotein with Yx(FWY)xxD motif
MPSDLQSQRRSTRRWSALPLLGGAAIMLIAACSSSSKSSQAVSSNGPASTAAPSTAAPSTAGAAAGPASPATNFSTANVTGVGTVVVDGSGRTVYVLTADGKTNLPCEDASGCTKFWPDLPFPDGVNAAQAGSGVQASMLASKKLSDGETYPTYNGWLMYEFKNDSGPGQAHGEGIKSFGGTWYTLDASGNLVMPGGAASSASSSSGY